MNAICKMIVIDMNGVSGVEIIVDKFTTTWAQMKTSGERIKALQRL